MIAALISVLATGLGVSINKLVLSFKLAGPRLIRADLFTVWLFVFLFFLTLLVQPWLGGVSPTFFTLKVFLLFLLDVGVAVGWNISYYRILQKETLIEFDLLTAITPILTALFGVIILSDERKVLPVLGTALASLALVLAHIRHHRLVFGRYFAPLLLIVALMAFEAVLVKLLLPHITPATLYLFRTFLVFWALFLIWRPNLLNINLKSVTWIVVIAAFGVVQMVAFFTAIGVLGVVETALVLTLGPVLIYLISLAFFKEPFRPLQALAGAIILLTIILVEGILR